MKTDLSHLPANKRRELDRVVQKDAYVKARYSKHYRISKDELEWLGQHVEELGQAVHDVCKKRIAELRSQALQV
ncbi:hypothetical protein [Sphingobium nicotianae]|uniref:Uncharacterized protein n=1 Tax=Sphingobium nicotianae TaxID=2782607 RepID=A0A9X1DGA3_9SPHN|nr:hypothetical protein [Sphingobium nicotianae]